MARPMKAVPVGEEVDEATNAWDAGEVVRKKRGWKKRLAPSMQSGTTASMAIDVEGDENGMAASQSQQQPSRAQSPSNDLPVPEEASEPVPSIVFPAPSSPTRPETPISNQPAAETSSQPPDPQASPSVDLPDSNAASTQPHLPSPLSSLTPHSTPARTAQATFLSKLMDAKKALGETDSVTVYATRTQTATGPGAQEKLKATEKEDRGREGELVLIEDDAGDGEDGGRGIQEDKRTDGEGEERREETGEGGIMTPGHRQRRRRVRGSSGLPRRSWRGRVKKSSLRLQPRDRLAAFRGVGETRMSQEVQQPMGAVGSVPDEGVEEARRTADDEPRGEGNNDRAVGDGEAGEL